VNFWYIAEGTGAVRIDGHWVEFTASDLVTIKPGENYDQEKAGRKSPYKVYFVQFDPFKQGNSHIQQHFFDPWPRVVSLKYYPEVKDLFMECFEVFNTRSASSRLLEKSILFRIFHVVIDAYQSNPSEIPSKGYAKFVHAKQYIYGNYSQPLHLDQIAEEAGLSSSHLSSLFKKYLKISPINYQINVKLRYARLFLAKGIPVTKVSANVGFNSVHHFSRVFKKHFGMPPSQFALQRRRK
jgi:AraC-like DNA-binding protein